MKEDYAKVICSRRIRAQTMLQNDIRINSCCSMTNNSNDLSSLHQSMTRFPIPGFYDPCALQAFFLVAEAEIKLKFYDQKIKPQEFSRLHLVTFRREVTKLSIGSSKRLCFFFM